jgi:hypothetical protein
MTMDSSWSPFRRPRRRNNRPLSSVVFVVFQKCTVKCSLIQLLRTFATNFIIKNLHNWWAASKSKSLCSCVIVRTVNHRVASQNLFVYLICQTCFRMSSAAWSTILTLLLLILNSFNDFHPHQNDAARNRRRERLSIGVVHAVITNGNDVTAMMAFRRAFNNFTTSNWNSRNDPCASPGELSWWRRKKVPKIVDFMHNSL